MNVICDCFSVFLQDKSHVTISTLNWRQTKQHLSMSISVHHHKAEIKAYIQETIKTHLKYACTLCYCLNGYIDQPHFNKNKTTEHGQVYP